MGIVDPSSLAATLDATNDALFHGLKLPKAERVEAAKWIASRQGLPGAYGALFAPTPRDFSEGIRLFTGEELHTRGGSAHILGEEACRALYLLEVSLPAVQTALDRAGGEPFRYLQTQRRIAEPGWFCCGKCSVALWRHLAVRDPAEAEPHLANAMRLLRGHRAGDGKWRPFPFWYTVLTLSDTNVPGATEELSYAAAVLEKAAKRRSETDRFKQRRATLAERALSRV